MKNFKVETKKLDDGTEIAEVIFDNEKKEAPAKEIKETKKIEK